ncbi:D-proline reductase (dithiol) proprotein PrdA [Thermohalobacter berrensis]|uniref:D-proline reductase (Dithiol) proprotein PrdA n=1 Tax=Thermohalobacter berrensis TaxID=99594 RepID=A0A419T8R8_9FIRM|nr:D-proline reductase (dithiol) proprotein PrdA [Thermohalobacter berrensis]RKD33798.1 D-proline reductase (dithiol) proprotein PrdA [Thermohalobacter berrensis]
MSITEETAKQHANDYAVTCCRFEAGTVIDPSTLEDPNIFPDLEDSGLLEIPENCLKIGEVLGAKLKETVDALTPLTSDLLDGVNKMEETKEEVEEVKEETNKETNKETENVVQPVTNIQSGSVKIHIGEGKNIDLEIPLGMVNAPGVVNNTENNSVKENEVQVVNEEKTEKDKPAKEIRRLKRKYFKIDKVEFGDETKIEGSTLYIRKDICEDAKKVDPLVVDMKVDIIGPEKYGEYSETIMDVQPIATKEEGKLGEGTTRVLDGAIMMVTGTDENGVQIGEFGSSEGILEKNIMWGRPGAPDKGEIFIKTEVTIKEHTNMERPGPLAAHKATDFITQEIREALKKLDDNMVADEEEFVQYRRPGKKKVVVIKEIMGQGAMHDNLILPMEPVGVLGGKPNVDLGNVPVVLSPLEVLDGGIHALVCIGPASKETSRHYWREPLVLEAMQDEEIDLAGVVFVGSPQINSEKFYVSERLGMLIESMDVDGAIITTEGFGNNHIDFASHHQQVGKRDVSVVGMTFAAQQGALVVGNKYMKHMIDLNKSDQGIENEILSNNTLCQEDAIRALAMLKTVMAGEEVKQPERKWNPNVKVNNVELIEKETNKKIDLVENEQVLPKSKKRKEIYEKEE